MINTGITKERTDIPEGRRLGFGHFIAAIVFLANPCLNIIDILPDFLGYVFLLKGLTKWADLCPNVRDAVTGISKLRWFMLIKMLAMALVPLVDATYVLVFTFSFIVIELIFALPAAWRIFDGLEYFGTRFDGKGIFRGIKDARALTTVFFIVKSAFCLFPELCELSSYEYSGIITNGVQIDPAAYKNPLIILNLFVGSVIGIVWLVSLVRYTLSVFRDKDFLRRVLADYELEIGGDVGLAIRRTLRSAITLLIAGFAFFPSLYIDGINVIPTFIGASFIIAASVKLTQLSGEKDSTAGTAVLLTALSAISFISMIAAEIVTSLEMTSPENITDNLLVVLNAYLAGAEDAAKEAVSRLDILSTVTFGISVIAALAEHITMAVCTVRIIKVLRRLTASHLAPDPDITDKRLCTIYSEDIKETDRSLAAGLVFFAIAIVISTVYAVIRTAIPPSFYLVPLIALGIWIVYMISTLNSIYGQIEYKYM